MMETEPTHVMDTTRRRLNSHHWKALLVNLRRTDLFTFPPPNPLVTDKMTATWPLVSRFSGRGLRCTREIFDKKSSHTTWNMARHKISLPFLPRQLLHGIIHFRLPHRCSWLRCARSRIADPRYTLAPPGMPRVSSSCLQPALWSSSRTIRTLIGAQDRNPDSQGVRSTLTDDIRFRRNLCNPTTVDRLSVRVATFPVSPFHSLDEVGLFPTRHTNHAGHLARSKSHNRPHPHTPPSPAPEVPLCRAKSLRSNMPPWSVPMKSPSCVGGCLLRPLAHSISFARSAF